LGSTGIFLALYLQSSVNSEMKNLTFGHMTHFRHRHFPDAQHDFLLNHPDDFLSQCTSDMAGEAFDQAVAREYMSRHKQPAQYLPSSNPSARAGRGRFASQEQRQTRKQGRCAMPKHFFINQNYSFSHDQGDVWQ